ncbi:MAG: hypothetical protein NXI00_17200 [Cytophagales bacterium]|nr:hypothetical protein [Cytophagales bacterium]
MKSKFIVFSAFALLAFTSCTQSASNEAANVNTLSVDEVKYVCPMKCDDNKEYASAGECPVCGMDLVEVKTEMDFETHKGSHPEH